MKTTRVMLSMPEPMLTKLMEMQKEYSYPSLQQTILQIIRDCLYAKSAEGKTGRPKKFDEVKLLTRKKIFS